MNDELARYLDALSRDECYRVDAVFKDAPHEITERVCFVGKNDAQLGPFLRKQINKESGIGPAYKTIYDAQKDGKRFKHLPHLFDYYERDDTIVVIMEYVDAETLKDVVCRRGPTLSFACDVFPRLCDAVKEMHTEFNPPLIHRDLKPSNIMLSPANITIIDFGIARSFKDGAEEDTYHFGTRAYAPPEQFGFGQTDVRSDIYALGMLLYFCLTGQTPDSDARKNAFRAPSVPQPVQDVIKQATALDPAKRYASVEELKQAFIAAVRQFGYQPACGCADTDALSADASHAGFSSGKGAARTSAFGQTLAKIPQKLGLIWDIALVAFFLLLCLGMIAAIIDPSRRSAQYASAPLWLRVVSDGSLAFLIMAPILFAVSDRRPLRKLVKSYARIPLERDMAVLFVVMLIGFAVFIFTCSLLPPA